jgi:PAS domain S-box-containing protein
MEEVLKILIVEDLLYDVELVIHELKRNNLNFIYKNVEVKEDYLVALNEFKPDIILSDYTLPEFDGMEALELKKIYSPLTPFILITGSLKEETAVDVMKSGADDYIIKEHIHRLVPAILSTLEKKEVRSAKEKTESVLKESEEKYRFLVDNTADTISLIDLNLNFIYVSPSVLRLRGFTTEEVIGQRLQDCVTPASFAKFYSILQKDMLFNESQETDPDRVRIIELEIYRKDGSTIWVENSERFVRDKNGKISGLLAVSKDITARKIAEEALIKSEEKLRVIFSAMKDVVIVVDDNGRYLEIAPTDPTLLYKPPEEIIGKTIHELFPKEKADYFLDSIKRTLETQTTVGIHYSLPIGGEDHWFDAKLSPMSSNAVLMVARDVTERKRSEDELRESEKRYRMIIENLTEAYFETDREGLIYYCNPAFLLITEYKEEEVIGSLFFRFVVEEQSEMISDYYKMLMIQKKNEMSTEYIVQTKKGRRFWVEQSTHYEFNSKDDFVKATNILRDIDERRQVEEELRKSELEFRTVWENSASGMRITDANGTIFKVNKAFCKIFEKSKEELEQKLFTVTYPLDSSEHIKKAHQERFKSKTVKTNFEKELVIWNGRKVYLHVANSFLEIEGAEPLLLGVFTDISELKKKEKQIQEYAEDLREANETKDKFFSIIAHDLRSPFHGFLGLSSILAAEVDSLSLDELKNISIALNTSLHKQFELLTDLLNWAKLQNKNLSLELISFSLRNELSTVLESITLSAKQKEIELINDVDENLIIIADLNMLKLVLRNLISNGVKFTNQNGFVKVSAIKYSGEVKIIVSDNGVGIDELNKQKLFIEGIRHSSEGTKNEKGTGLGLLLCKEIVEKHGGKIWLESKFGEGSKFILTMPQTGIEGNK